MKNATLAILALLLARPAMAAREMTAGDLYSLCTSADESDLSACNFYVFGAVQGVILGATMTANRKFVEKNNTVICLPDAVSRNQMVAIVRDDGGAILFQPQLCPAAQGIKPAEVSLQAKGHNLHR